MHFVLTATLMPFESTGVVACPSNHPGLHRPWEIISNKELDQLIVAGFSPFKT